MRRLFSLIALASAAFLAVSCFDDPEVETTPQAAITSFALGYYYVDVNDINYLGHDTVIAVREGGVMYPMTIDQLDNRIYNTDSLAYGSRLNAVTCNISSTGTVVYEYSDDRGLSYLYSSGDSIDFTRPLTFSVASTDGSFLRKYDFKLNVHKVFPDSLAWRRTDAGAFPSLSKPLAAVTGDSLYVIGTDSQGKTSMISCDIRTGRWSTPVPTEGLPSAPVQLTVRGKRFHCLCGTGLYVSDDAVGWSAAASGIRCLYAPQNSSEGTVWAATDDGWLAESDDMASWTPALELPEAFPADMAVTLTYPLQTVPSFTRTIVAGRTAGSGFISFWTKLSTDKGWTMIELPENSRYRLPALDSPAMIQYDGSLFAFGCGFDSFWQSRDNGITWYRCDRYTETWSTWNRYMQFPKALDGCTADFAYATDNYCGIWILTSNGQAWRGAINRLDKLK